MSHLIYLIGREEMKISFALLCYTESKSLMELLAQLTGDREYDYEIVVVFDPSGEEGKSFVTRTILETIQQTHNGDKVKVFERPLNNHYSDQKNFMTEQCTGDWIVNPDADELFPIYILNNIHLIIEQSDTECIWLPRINIVEGMTAELAPRFGQKLDERGWINWPDPQNRIYLNDYPRIHWEKPVHERVVGYKTHSPLPFDAESAEHFAIKHIKTIDKQVKQNQKYAEIDPRYGGAR